MPDDYYVTALTPDTVVASDLNGTTTTVSRSAPDQMTSVPGLASWAVDESGTQLTGATMDGEALVLDLESGERTVIDTPGRVTMTEFSTESEVVGFTYDGLESSTATDTVFVCPPERSDCQRYEYDGVTYLPNGALGQLLAQTS